MTAGAGRPVVPRPDARVVREIEQVPRIARWLLPVAAMLRRGSPMSSIEPRVRILVMVHAAAADASAYWLDQLHRVAGEVGVDPSEVQGVVAGTWRDLASLSPRERAALRWAEGVATNDAKRDRDGFADLQEHFSTAEIVELTALGGMCALLDRFANAMRLDPGGEDFDAATPVGGDDLLAWAHAAAHEPGDGRGRG